MSLFAGIYSLNDGVSPPNAMRAEMRNAITRNAEDEIIEFSSTRCYLAKIDIGAFGSKGHLDDGAGNFSMLTGEPLLPGDRPAGREADLVAIRESLGSERTDLLELARGVFAAADYREKDGVLTFMTDRLGIRPVYYWVGAEFMIFSSTLRVIETMSCVPKKMDLRAVTEIAALNYAVADRTPYCGVKLLGPGGIVRAMGREITVSTYSDWNDIPISKKPEEQLLVELYNCFVDAVAIRQRGDSGAVAYLSGGLDSRCVTAALCEQAKNVHTFNFAREKTQDQLFGRQFAEQAASIHSEVPKQPGDLTPDYSLLLANAWKASNDRIAAPVERPKLAWSGEGGSVDLGHVHIGPQVPPFLRAGDARAAVEEFLFKDEIALPLKLFRTSLRDRISSLVVDGIVEQIETYRCEDPARKFYLFMMLNDQRRKLAGHFENLDRHRLEFQLPFFDTAFVKLVMSIPLDLCVLHKLYVKWLDLFPKSVASVAWQAYPDHVPCPVAVPAGLAYQWDNKHLERERSTRKRSLVRRAAAVLKAKDFPTEILDRARFGVAVAAYASGVRDYGYLVETAEVYYKYWNKCSGIYMPLPAQ
ncbi:MAG: asparagine synthase-related protein [Acidobacteriota bacterium]